MWQEITYIEREYFYMYSTCKRKKHNINMFSSVSTLLLLQPCRFFKQDTRDMSQISFYFYIFAGSRISTSFYLRIYRLYHTERALKSISDWNLSECGWDLAECGLDLAERLERLAVNAKVATVLGSIPAFSDTVESEKRQMKQCAINGGTFFRVYFLKFASSVRKQSKKLPLQ